jgi:hypothetical protein
MRDEFTTFDIVKALDIPRERLQDWINREFIKPSIPAMGQGTKAIFTRDDVYSVALFKSFIEQGYNRLMAGVNCKKFTKYGRLKYYKRFFFAIWKGKGSIFKADVEYINDPEEMSPRMKKVYWRHQENVKRLEESYDEELRLDMYIDEDLLEEYAFKYGRHRYKEPQEVIQSFFKDGKPKSLGDKGEWDHLVIVNFEKIRRNVDMALSGI